ncbi:MAG TPA: peptidylprolyl isomerase [Thermoanaerobaculia bacterium]|nr:peptidylprolyl isomerase [Thermoanaerobaculia bacterium]
MKRPAGVAFLLLIFALPLAAEQVAYQTKTVLSPVYTIDRKFKSMEGPQSSEPVYLVEGDTPELLWLIGVSTVMVGEDGVKRQRPELMCHVNLDLDVAAHREIFGWTKSTNARIVTLSQGQLSARYPDGFGMPIMSHEPLLMTTQVLNHNIEKPNLKVRHKVTFEFVRDRDLKTPLRPLFNTGIFGMALVEGPDGIFGRSLEEPAGEEHGTSCMIGTQAPNAMGGSEYRDAMGRIFTGHWVVKPGREVNHTNVTKFLGLPFDTTLHYAAVHLHPYAESLELRDLTTGETVFKSRAKGPRRGIGLTHVESFTSSEGIFLYKDHQYELISVYNNTTKNEQDSMAVMYLSPLDMEFRHPEDVAAERARIQREKDDAPRLVLTTVTGEMTFRLLQTIAPRTVEQFSALVRAGIYDDLLFTRIEPGFVAQVQRAEARDRPLSAEQRSLIRKLALESSPAVRHHRGALAMAREDDDPDSAETSFYIVLGDAPHLDGKYTLFGVLESGLAAIEEMERVPLQDGKTPLVRVRIVRAEVLERAPAVANSDVAAETTVSQRQ